MYIHSRIIKSSCVKLQFVYSRLIGSLNQGRLRIALQLRQIFQRPSFSRSDNGFSLTSFSSFESTYDYTKLVVTSRRTFPVSLQSKAKLSTFSPWIYFSVPRAKAVDCGAKAMNHVTGISGESNPTGFIASSLTTLPDPRMVGSQPLPSRPRHCPDCQLYTAL